MANKTNVKTWSVILIVLMTVFTSNVRADGIYSGGTGEPNNPYLISTPTDMNEIGTHPEDWNDCFLLTADINLINYNESNYNIIGNEVNSFTGVFDGDNRTISNFSFSAPNSFYVGLFGYIDGPGAEIKDLRLIDPNIQGYRYIGALVGGLQNGTITGCGIEGGTVSGTWFVGGLAGISDYYCTISHCYSTVSVFGSFIYAGNLIGYNIGIISNCYSTGSVSGDQRVGGLVGQNYSDGIISNCRASGPVTGDSFVGGLAGSNLYGKISKCCSTGPVSGDEYVGGLVGYNFENTSKILNCYAISPVMGTNGVGGLVGYNCSDDSTISNCYSAGSVTGTSGIGGLVGDGSSNRVLNSYWDIQTSGQTASVGGQGKATTQMKTATTFITWGACDNYGIWTIDDGNDYPRLAWQGLTGTLLPETELADYLLGTGQAHDPYLITNAEQLNLIGLFPCELDKHFKLINDINLIDYNGTNFNLIGNDVNSFTGVFDGNNHTISNLKYSSPNSPYVGLFRYIDDPNAEIKDLILRDTNIQGDNYVGALVGGLQNGTITGCGINGGVVAGDYYVGGLTGYNDDCTISNCYATCSASADSFSVGGLVGFIYKGKISSCYASGPVSGGSSVGGLVGRTMGFSFISNCYATGMVSGDNGVGGLVGNNDTPYGITILNSYASGPVSGNNYFGGLVGRGGATRISNSYWDIQTSGQTVSVGGNGKTTTQMKTANTFIGWGGCGNYGIWTIDDGNDYPRLAWQGLPGTPLPELGLADYLQGTGLANNPYLISNAQQLSLISSFPCELDKHFKLTADINLVDYNETNFNIIGNDVNTFTGVFDGNFHTISNFTWNSADSHYVGLFSSVDDPNARIKDLILIDPVVHGDWRVGVLVGTLQNGTITGCCVESGTVSGEWYVGSLVGYSKDCKISSCYATGSVSGQHYVGGLVGFNYGSTISNCYTDGSVSGDSFSDDVGGLVGNNRQYSTISNCCSTSLVSGRDYIGGLVGSNSYYSYISNCYAAGSVTAYNNYVGGLVGYNYSHGDISNCYAMGPVSGGSYGDYVGGLTGYNSETGSVLNCFATGPVTGADYVGGFAGNNSGVFSFSFWDIETSGTTVGVGQGNDDSVYGLSTELMQMQVIYDIAGWDFVNETFNGLNDVWTMHDGVDYPQHVWELVNFIGWYEVDFTDFAYLAVHWLDENCDSSNDCDGADLDFSDSIDEVDLKIFIDHWLDGIQ
jgi:hypothetical protein